jgi:predicted DNA-binding WGR domain protein
MSYIKEEMLLKVSAEKNNNKFYHVALEPSGRVMKRWGRVGSNGQSQFEMGGETSFQRIVNKKTKEGYYLLILSPILLTLSITIRTNFPQ